MVLHTTVNEKRAPAARAKWRRSGLQLPRRFTAFISILTSDCPEGFGYIPLARPRSSTKSPPNSAARLKFDPFVVSSDSVGSRGCRGRQSPWRRDLSQACASDARLWRGGCSGHLGRGLGIPLPTPVLALLAPLPDQRAAGGQFQTAVESHAKSRQASGTRILPA